MANKFCCSKHKSKQAFYTRLDKYGSIIWMCDSCQMEWVLSNIEILVCKHCDVIVRSEDDTRAKFESRPHQKGCPRYVEPPKVPTFTDFGFYEDSRRERKHPFDGA